MIITIYLVCHNKRKKKFFSFDVKKRIQIKNALRSNQKQNFLDLIIPMQVSLGNEQSFVKPILSQKLEYANCPLLQSGKIPF